MATAIKVLGQAAPALATPTDLYTVPASTSTVSSSICVCNRTNQPETFRISIRPAGAVQADQHYTHFNMPIPANDTYIATIGFTLATTDVVTVYSSAGGLSFNLFGKEVT